MCADLNAHSLSIYVNHRPSRLFDSLPAISSYIIRLAGFHAARKAAPAMVPAVPQVARGGFSSSDAPRNAVSVSASLLIGLAYVNPLGRSWQPLLS
jgi:hypothetical protein